MKTRPTEYRGLDRFEARQQIVNDLEQQGLLEKIDDHKLMIPRGDRSHAVVEPYLTDQWYVKIAPLAEPAIEAVEDGRIEFVPANWSKTYFDWMHRIEDWCISRQLWWGHRIPAWYDGEGKSMSAPAKQDARQRSGLADDIAAAAGRGCSRHLVFFRALAIYHPGLAGKDRLPGAILSDQRAW